MNLPEPVTLDFLDAEVEDSNKEEVSSILQEAAEHRGLLVESLIVFRLFLSSLFLKLL